MFKAYTTDGKFLYELERDEVYVIEKALRRIVTEASSKTTDLWCEFKVPIVYFENYESEE